MSTTADVCPFCLRYAGFDAARAAGTRYCPLCGTDWQSLEARDAENMWREDSVVLPLPLPARSVNLADDPEADVAEPPFGDTGQVPALGGPDLRRAAAAALRLTPPPGEEAPWDTDADADDDLLRGAPLFPDEGHDDAPDAAGDDGLTPEFTEPAPAPPPPTGSPWSLVLGAAGAIALVVVGLVTLTDAGLAPPAAVIVTAPTPPPTAAPTAAPATAPPSLLPPLPSPRTSPERKSAAVKEHIERALEGQPDAVQAEVGVRVEDGIAFLTGTVDSPATRDRVASAAGEAFGIKAVDTRALKIEVRPPPQHMVEAGETLTSLARRLYGSGGQWRRIYEVNPGIDPNLIRVGQPLSLPPP